MKRLLALLAAGCLLTPLVQPAQALVDRKGATLDETAIREDGRHVVYVFWQSWCGSCRKEAPALATSARTLAGRAQFIGVISGPDDVVDERKVDRFITDMKLDYPQVRDRDLTLTRRFKVRGTPTIIVLNTQGEIVYRGHHAPERWSDILGP